MMQNMKRKHGFTLIELLVVIAIISLLVAILIPSLQKAKSLAQAVKCQSNLRSISLSLQMYTVDWDEYLPIGLRPADTWPNSTYIATLVLNGYVDCSLVNDPSDPHFGDNWLSMWKGGYPWGQSTISENVFFCPSAPGTIIGHMDPDMLGRSWESQDRTFCYGMTQFRSQSHPPAGGDWTTRATSWDDARKINSMSNPELLGLVADGEYVDICGWYGSSQRHNGKGHVVFFDFHLDAMEEEDYIRWRHWVEDFPPEWPDY